MGCEFRSSPTKGGGQDVTKMVQAVCKTFGIILCTPWCHKPTIWGWFIRPTRMIVLGCFLGWLWNWVSHINRIWRVSANWIAFFNEFATAAVESSVELSSQHCAGWQPMTERGLPHENTHMSLWVPQFHHVIFVPTIFLHWSNLENGRERWQRHFRVSVG